MGVRVPVINPWAYCGACGGEVAERGHMRNFPCGHIAEIGSSCPSWEPFHGCPHKWPADEHQGDQEAAAALQEALEDQEAQNLRALLRCVRNVEPPAPAEFPVNCRSSIISTTVTVVEVRGPRHRADPDPIAQAERLRATIAVLALAVFVVVGMLFTN